ncbi:hypothetical protein C2G38_2030026 [Gigaspora rosea]|uniref:Uncharacterized protein n=1 Tax=Gigaspora rosea TaxID=44941 RepID=A0A397VVN5_9GLOM|nr:hypothetical protein C2G38_2030026 [Gigaspora rosea]
MSNKQKNHTLYKVSFLNNTYNYLVQSLYKHKSDYDSLQDLDLELKALVKRTQSLGAKAQHFQNQKSKYITEIRSLVQRSKQITNDKFRKNVRSIFNINKKSYSSNTIWLAKSILQVGQTSLRSAAECMKLLYEFLAGEPPQVHLSTSILRTWHKDILELHFNRQICQAKNASVFGVMVDETSKKSYTVLSILNITKCNAETVSDVTIAHIQKSGLDVKKCAIWVTDNTLYMSVSQDTALCIYQNRQLAKLPPGRQAHEMHDKVYEWYKFLEVSINFEMFFTNELLEAFDVLSSESFFNNLEQGIVKALEHFKKWFLPWIHLPLTISHLGSNKQTLCF